MGMNIPSSVFPVGSFRSLWTTKRMFPFSRGLGDKHERAQVHTPRVRALRRHEIHGLPRTASRLRREVAVEAACAPLGRERKVTRETRRIEVVAVAGYGLQHNRNEIRRAQVVCVRIGHLVALEHS